MLHVASLTAPLFLGAFLTAVPDLLIWALRLAVFALTATWVLRTYRKERLFVSQATAPAGVRVGSTKAITAHRAAQENQPEVTFEPGDKRAVVEENATLLEVAEAQGLPIEAGCRMGVCFGCVVPLKSGAVRDLRNGEITTAVPGETDAGGVRVQTCINAAAGPCEFDL